MRALIFPLLLTALAACGSTATSTEEDVSHTSPEDVAATAEETAAAAAAKLEPAGPWTPSFTRGALLVANEIRVEGPRGLMQHIATRSLDPHHRQTVETIPEGFRQIFEVVNPNAGIEIRSHLDAMQIVAMQRLVVLERPGDVPVTILALGEVYYKRDGAEAVTRASLEIQGAKPR